MKIFITDNQGNLVPADRKSVVIELNNGSIIEIAEEYSISDVPTGINLWGDALHVFPYKVSSKELRRTN